MEITSANLQFLFTGYNMRYQDVVRKTVTYYQKVCTQIPVTSTTLVMPWLQVCKVREWEGDRVFQNFITQELTIKPRLFESTRGITKQAILDDQFGVFLSMDPAGMARAFALHPDQLLADAIEANAVTFDGVAFFSKSHPIDPSNPASGTQSNVLDGLSTSNAPAGLTPENVAALRAQMLSLKGPDGRPLSLIPNKIMAHPSLATAMRVAANAAIYPTNIAGSAGPVSNVWVGEYEVIENPNLKNSTDWFLICADEGIAPFIHALRQAPTFTTITDPENPLVFMNNQYAIGGEVREEVALGYYALCGMGTSRSL